MPKRQRKVRRPNRRRKRVRRAVSGHGPYNASTFLRPIAPALGAVAGFGLGGIPGALAGIGAGAAFNRVSGLGAYRLSPGGFVTTDQIPEMHRLGDGFVVHHREFLFDLSSSIAFTTRSVAINPGLFSSFPWLSIEAAGYEQYQITGMNFFFRSTSADALNSTNTALGTVIMSVDYNAASALPLNKITQEQMMWAVSGKPSEDMIEPVECDPKLNPMKVLYLRNSAIGNQDLKTYDLGRLDISTVGSQAVAVIGEVWCSYEVIFFKPQLTYGAPGITYGHHSLATVNIANATPLGNQVVRYSNMALTIDTTSITFPGSVSGRFEIEIVWQGVAVTALAPTLTVTNGTLLNLLTNSTVSNLFVGTGGGSAQSSYTIFVEVPLSNAVTTVAFGTLGTIQTSFCDIFVTQLNAAILQ